MFFTPSQLWLHILELEVQFANYLHNARDLRWFSPIYLGQTFLSRCTHFSGSDISAQIKQFAIADPETTAVQFIWAEELATGSLKRLIYSKPNIKIPFKMHTCGNRALIVADSRFPNLSSTGCVIILVRLTHVDYNS